MRAESSRANVTAAVTATILGAALLLAAQLLVKPIVGLADNGDFVKVMAPAGLAYLEEEPYRFFRWAPSKFAFAQPKKDPEGYVTSETLLARAAVVGAQLAGARLFDIRWMGALHAAILLVGIGLWMAAARDFAPAARWTGTLLLLFVFTDVGYAAPLNSLYGQAGSLVFFMLATGIAAIAIRRGVLTGPWLPAYFVAAGLFVCSKPQSSLQAPLLAVLGVAFAWPDRRRRAVAIGLAAVLLVAGHVYLRAAPQTLRRVCQYQTFFTEMLPNSPDPAADLRRVGLPESYARYSGTTAYNDDSPLKDPAFRDELDRKLGYRPLARIYLSEPARGLSVARRAAWRGAGLRPPFFGNLPRDTGAPPGAQSRRFGLWSAFKYGMRPWTAAIWPALLLGTTAVAIGSWRRASLRGRMARAGLVALCAMAVLEFAVCAFADAHLELVRHLFMFHAIIDLLLIAAVVWTVQALGRRRPEPR